MHSSQVYLRSASTAGGMRRILKKLPPVSKYIGQAVRAGIYYPLEEDAPKKRIPKHRRTFPNGTSVDDYPVEYEILTMNPLIPEEPRTPKKFKSKPPQPPTVKLAKKQLNRLQHSLEEELSIDDYYHKLLGIPRQERQTMLSLKSNHTQKAHAFAMKQYEVMRTEGVSEEESLSIVQKLLEQDSLNELRTSRQTTQTIVKETTTNQKEENATGGFIKDEKKKKLDDIHSIPSVLHDQPRTIAGLNAWSQRLALVDYKEWTVGATTALDHWIALSVLNLSEASWLELLQGSNPDLTSRGRDIVTVRHALFPETILDDKEEETEYEMSIQDEQEVDVSSSADKTIDELLKSLESFDGDEEEENDFFEHDDDDDMNKKDEDVLKLVNELQEWRTKQQAMPHEDWSSQEKQEFEDWLQFYLKTVVASSTDKEVDLDATRQALLEVPPMSKDDSEKFWARHADEAAADEWLQRIDTASLKEQDKNAILKAFFELPYPYQIQKMVQLGALEPIWNEYTPESERLAFLQRYSHLLLQDVNLEHLMEDSEGPISALDMGESWMQQHGVDKTARFRISTTTTSRDDNLSQKELYQAYSTHKVGRARYEEAMFQKGNMGLKYGEKPKKKQQNEDDDDEW